MDEFCSLLAYILVQTDSSWIEMESEFIWGLIHPCMLAGEGGYYLTMLSSTIHFIKNLDQQEDEAEDGEGEGGSASGRRVEGGGDSAAVDASSESPRLGADGVRGAGGEEEEEEFSIKRRGTKVVGKVYNEDNVVLVM